MGDSLKALGSYDFAPALAGGTAGLRVAGGIMESRAAMTTARAQRDAANYNAQLSLREGAVEEARLRRGAGQMLALYEVEGATSGVQREGSRVEFMAAAASELERDAMNARISAQSTAALERARAENVMTVGRQRRFASLLDAGFDVGGFGVSLLRGGADNSQARLADSRSRSYRRDRA